MRDAVATMGTILPDEIKEGSRDAVHVACIAVTSVWAKPLKPCTNVNKDGVPVKQDDCVGIVDPFLRADVQPGEKFWLYLYPRTITGLNHHWTHPAFPEKHEYEHDSVTWLKEFCRDNDCPAYEDLIEFAEYHNREGRHDEGFWIGDQESMAEIPVEFWTHLGNVTGHNFKGKEARYFRCAC